MTDILKEIIKDLPSNKISDANFEGANIVLYTKDKDFFLNDKNLVREIVNKIKKRIELRPDPELCMEPEKAEKEIKKIIGKEAGIDKILFDPQRSIVIIEVEKPGNAIGRQGDTLQEIKAKTCWVPVIKRKPAIRSQLIENIRSVLYQNSDYRKKFLHKTGQRIYNGWLRGKKDEWVRITPLGGARQVGRSAILLQTPESRVLLDCGVDVASDKHPYPHLEAPEFDIKELDAIIVSHAHADHSGLVPLLYKYGYRGPVYCTMPTRDISALMQLDMIKIQRDEKDSLYASEDVVETVKHTITLDYGEVTDITPDIRITFYNSGHILGGAMVHAHIGNGLHNFLYTGDVKYAKTNLLSPAHTNYPRLETMMIESTYGSKESVKRSQREQDQAFGDLVANTVKRGGKVLMPVLGSGRAQEIIVLLERMIREGVMKSVPIFIDGMVWDITAIHTAYPEYLNNTVREQIFHKDNNPFIQENIKRIGSAKERKELVEDSGPCIILATSGMLVGGPSVGYLRDLADNPKNSLIFTCYQGEGSLGRLVQSGLKEISMRNQKGKNELVEIKLEVHKLEITGHSDRRELMSFINKCSPRPKKVIVNHGDSSSCLDFARTIHKTYRIETIAPKNLESVRLV